MIIVLLIIFLGLLLLKEFLQFERYFGHLRQTFPSCFWTFCKHSKELTNSDNGLNVALKLFSAHKTTSIICCFPACKLLVYDPKLIELILTTNMNKTHEYSFIKSWLKDGILTSDREKWKVQKRLLAPAFHLENLKRHLNIFHSMSETLISKLEAIVDEPSIDISNYMILCTLDIILATALGAAVNVQTNPTSDYINSIKIMCDVLYDRTFSMNRFERKYRWTELSRREQFASRILNDFSRDFIIEQRKSPPASNTILDILLENEQFTDEQILEQINTIIFAGHDTTGYTLSFALYALSRHGDIQEKVYQEILEVIGMDNTPTYKDLEDLIYMSMVLKEVSRLYPAVPVFTRRITKEIEWKNTVIPVGVEAYFVPYAIHRREDIYPDPEKFDPERFNAENIAKIPSGAYLPFSNGPRSCIGQKFANLEMRAILVNLLRKFVFLPAQPAHEVFPVGKVTLQSKNGVKLRLKKRIS